MSPSTAPAGSMSIPALDTGTTPVYSMSGPGGLPVTYGPQGELLFTCFLLGCIISIPVRSWLWPLLATLVKQSNHPQFVVWYFALTAIYEWLSAQPKDHSLGTAGIFDGLAIHCDGSHEYQLWFATKTESNDPMLGFWPPAVLDGRNFSFLLGV